MANPQTENGFIRIATQIYEALVQIRISGEARQCLDFIIRKTYGWQKKEDYISLSQFVLATGLSKVAVSKSLKKLESMKLIVITKKGKGDSNLYRFNKSFDEWKPLPKKVTLPKKVKSVTKKGKELLPKKQPTKDTYTKDTTTKDSSNAKIKNIIKDLNQICGSSYKPTTPKTQELIKARLKEGFTIDDFKIVHQKMEKEWGKDPKMSAYLRPQTLYGTKFESYLQRKKPRRRKIG